MAVFEVETPKGIFEVEGPDLDTIVKTFNSQFGGAAPAAAAPAEPAEPGATFAPSSPRNFRQAREDLPVGMGEAAGRGFARGLFANYPDELAGTIAAAEPRVKSGQSALGAFWDVLRGNDPEANAISERATADYRARDLQAQKERPYTSLGGEVAGMLPYPGGIAGRGATMGAKMLGGAIAGAGYGALSGSGAGTDTSSRAINAAVGAPVGGAIGAVAQPVASAVGAVANYATRPFRDIAGGINPTRTGQRMIGEAMEQDARGTAPRLTESEMVYLRDAGFPVANVDMGGKAVLDLARTATNKSPEALDALETLAQSRFQEQGSRYGDFMRGTTSAGSTQATRDNLEALAQRTNTPAYERAYKDGNFGIWDPELEFLIKTPQLKPAVRRALLEVETRSASQVASNKPSAPFIDANGRPTLATWDVVKQRVDDLINTEMRAGNRNEVRMLTQIKNRIVEKLDSYVPTYADARAGAAALFGAKDAIEAGEKLVTSKMPLDVANKAWAKFSPVEQDLARHGYASALLRKVDGYNPSIDLNKKIGSAIGDRAQLEMVFGPRWMNYLDTFRRSELVMDRLRGALGNSTTARQLSSMGRFGDQVLSHGRQGATGAAIGWAVGGDTPDMNSLLAGSMTYGLLRGRKVLADKVGVKVAQEVGRMLASNDPAIFSKGVEIASRNNAMAGALRNMSGKVLYGQTDEYITPVQNALSSMVPSAKASELPPGEAGESWPEPGQPLRITVTPRREGDLAGPGEPNDWRGAVTRSELSDAQVEKLQLITGHADPREAYHAIGAVDASPDMLVAAKSAMGPKAWGEFTEAKIRSIGRDKVDAPFEARDFTEAWAAQPEAFKNLIAPEHRKALDSIAGTRTLELLQARVGGLAVSQWVADPKTARAVAQWSAATEAATKMPSQKEATARMDAAEKKLADVVRANAPNDFRVTRWLEGAPEARSYDPTLRERIGGSIAGEDKNAARKFVADKIWGSSGLGHTGGGPGGMGLVDLTPIGAILGAQESRQRDEALGTALGGLPGGGPASRAGVKAMRALTPRKGTKARAQAEADAAAKFEQRAAASNDTALMSDEDLAFLGLTRETASAPVRSPTKQPVTLGMHPTTTPEAIIDATLKGGYSVNLATGDRPQSGLMVGKYRNEDPRNLVVPTGQLTAEQLAQHAKRNRAQFERTDTYYGSWQDPETGKTYLDVSRRLPEGKLRQAVKYGERTGQLKGYDAGKGDTFDIGNWRQFIKGDEYHQRLRDLNAEGRAYLDQFPAKEWWDMHGSSFERIYGPDPERMKQIAGLTASTAPNTSPYENLQQMSEYARRLIAGEKVVQPRWRSPGEEGGYMSLAKGKQMPMEQSRANNLNKSSRGDLNALGKNKVRNEALAMTGDPNAVVIDRHHVRVAEAPERNIFADVKEGQIRAGRDYETLQHEITAEAKAAGFSPRDFSANVWAAIRERIKNTGELFGTKHGARFGDASRGNAVTGDSKSYADILDDVVADKAKWFGITREQMEDLLRRGEASLLAAVMSTPVIAQMLAQQPAAPGEQRAQRVSPDL